MIVQDKLLIKDIERCPSCFAVVLVEDEERHQAWHNLFTHLGQENKTYINEYNAEITE